MTDLKAADYIANLPEVETSRLPKDTLFFAQGKIYQVIETGGSGYHKAREWRQTEATDVALIPGSFPARYLPLVKRGYVLPVYRSRLELTENNQPTCYVFPTESLALDAAYLDVALIHNGGAFVRNHGNEPAFAATDGVHVFRLFYYRVSQSGRKTNLSSLLVRPLAFHPSPHTDGPGYWQLLTSWTEIVPNPDITQQMRPISLVQNALEESDTQPLSDETLPNLPTMHVSSDE